MFREIPQTLDALEKSATTPLEVLQNLPAEDQPEAIFSRLIENLSGNFDFLLAVTTDDTFETPLRSTAFQSLLTFFDNVKAHFPTQQYSFRFKEIQKGPDWRRASAARQIQLGLFNDPIFGVLDLQSKPYGLLSPEQIIFTAHAKKGDTLDNPSAHGVVAFLGKGKIALFLRIPAFDLLAEFDSEGNFIPKSSDEYVPLSWIENVLGSDHLPGLFYDNNPPKGTPLTIWTNPS